MGTYGLLTREGKSDLDSWVKGITEDKLHIVGYQANKHLHYLVELFEADKLNPVIDTCFPLEETAEAFRYFGEGLFKGKIVVTTQNA